MMEGALVGGESPGDPSSMFACNTSLVLSCCQPFAFPFPVIFAPTCDAGYYCASPPPTHTPSHTYLMGTRRLWRAA